MKTIYFGIFFGWIVSMFTLLHAQNAKDIQRYRYTYPGMEQDSIRLAKKAARKKFINSVRPTERFDLVFNNGFMITSGMPDSLPIRSVSSGTTYLGLSYNLIFSTKWMAKFQAGWCSYAFTFVNTNRSGRFYSFEADTTLNRRIGLSFIDFPLAVSYVFQTDTVKGRFISMIEAGPTIGFILSRKLSYRQTLNGRAADVSYSDIPHIYPIKLGFYAKLTYGIIGLWVYHRLNPVFSPSEKMETEGRAYPGFSRWEIGFSLVL